MMAFLKSKTAVKLLACGYFLTAIALFLYSYTQVDLNLTLTQVGIWQSFQKMFQNIGYYYRPISLNIYLTILFILYLLYAVLLVLLHKNLINKKQLCLLICMVTSILVFSYPAFSYDIFNYMFTAKTVLIYHKNPYVIIPLQFSGIDPYLNFMRWTHLPSAYTPLWIAITLPAYIFGFGNFLISLFNIKIIIAIFYLFTSWFIYKILKKIDEQKALVGVGIFALNPLNLIETLISGHNDVVMMAIAIFSVFLYMQKKNLLAYFILVISIGIKLMTLFLFPAALLGWRRGQMLITMIIGFILVLLVREPLPWYFVWLLPFVALLPRKKYVTIFAAIFSLGLALRYAPFIYYGHWNSPVTNIIFQINLASIAIGFLLVLALYLNRKKQL